MHIAEGILPASWAALWFLATVPVLFWGLRQIKHKSQQIPQYKTFVALIGAAVFVLSCMPIPVPFTGTCAHPCGTGLAAILIQPAPTAVVASIALTLQALFMAHGGVTTLGANIFSMGVAGAFVGYAAFCVSRRMGAPVVIAAFLAGLLSDWATYTLTSVALASALHGSGSFGLMLKTILVAFIPTQLPLGILEGLLAAKAFLFIRARLPQLLDQDQAEL
jgi:cobalt/nickel transport system permease protein